MVWVAGVDGCRGGWVVVLMNMVTSAPRWRIVVSFDELINLPECPVVLAIDMPLGLPAAAEPGGRECDRQARRFLGARRACSVFSPPTREALSANSYRAAVSINRASSPYRIGVSKQCFGLFPKLVEVDARMTTALQVRVKEVHPEVCFYVMNGNRPLPYSKRSSEGLALRRRLTERRGFGQLITQALRDETTSAKGAKHADVLDACAACWTAERIHGSRAIRIPDSPARDAKGLSMEIWA